MIKDEKLTNILKEFLLQGWEITIKKLNNERDWLSPTIVLRHGLFLKGD